MMSSISTARDKHVSTRRFGVAIRAAIPLFGIAIALTAAGSLDSAFDDDGLLSLSACDNFGRPHAVIEQANGNIVIAGVCYAGNFGNFTLARVMPDGQLDDGFGSGGTCLGRNTQLRYMTNRTMLASRLAMISTVTSAARDG